MSEREEVINREFGVVTAESHENAHSVDSSGDRMGVSSLSSSHSCDPPLRTSPSDTFVPFGNASKVEFRFGNRGTQRSSLGSISAQQAPPNASATHLRKSLDGAKSSYFDSSSENGSVAATLVASDSKNSRHVSFEVVSMAKASVSPIPPPLQVDDVQSESTRRRAAAEARRLRMAVEVLGSAVSTTICDLLSQPF